MLERNRRAVEAGREPRQIPELPPGWEGWSEALDEAQMAKRYGWTPEQIDEVDKARVHKWWAVEDIHKLASQYLHQVQGGIQNALQMDDRKGR